MHGEVLAERHPVERTALIHPRRDASRDRAREAASTSQHGDQTAYFEVLKMATVKLQQPPMIPRSSYLLPTQTIIASPRGEPPQDADLPNSTNNCSDASYSNPGVSTEEAAPVSPDERFARNLALLHLPEAMARDPFSVACPQPGEG